MLSALAPVPLQHSPYPGQRRHHLPLGHTAQAAVGRLQAAIRRLVTVSRTSATSSPPPREVGTEVGQQHPAARLGQVRMHPCVPRRSGP